MKTGKNEIVSPARLGYADGVLWKRTWQPEIVMTLAGGVLMAFFSGALAAELLRRSAVAGFDSTYAVGNVLLATLSFHGAAIVAGILFLKFHGISWREAAGGWQPDWARHAFLAATVLVVLLPEMFGLKILSELALEKLGWPTDDQAAVQLFLNVKSVGLKIYLVVFAVVIAPLAEELIFRGLIFSGLKQAGWTKTAWLGSSLLFAVVHGNAAVFLPLFVFALGLTWLYQRTEGLFAPVLAHSLFNALNLALLLGAQKAGLTLP